jgi:hypothetical protein
MGYNMKKKNLKMKKKVYHPPKIIKINYNYKKKSNLLIFCDSGSTSNDYPRCGTTYCGNAP